MSYTPYCKKVNITDFLQCIAMANIKFFITAYLLKTKREREATNQHRNNKRKIISISFLFNQTTTKNNNSVIIPFH